MRQPLRQPHPIRTSEIENYEETVDYLVYKDGSTIIALNGSTGKEDSRDTDIGVVLQYCIDALTSGGHIHVKNGQYSLSTQVNLNQRGITLTGHNWALYGTGDGTRIKMANGVNLARMIYITAANTQMRNFMLDGNKANNPTAWDAIVVSGSNDSVFENVTTKYINRDGFALTSITCNLYNCVGEYCDRNGFNLINSNKNEFTNCRMGGNALSLVMTGNSFENVFIGCRFLDSSGSSVVLQGGTKADYNKILGCRFKSAAGLGIRGLGLEGAKHNIIVGNTFYNCCQATDNAADCIILDTHGGRHSEYNIITDNMIFSDAANQPRYGINEVDVNQDHNIIENNTIVGAVTAAINPNGAASQVHGNIGWMSENGGVTGAVADGGTFAHGLAGTPIYCIVTGTITGDLVSVSALGAANVTVAIKDEGGGAGTAQALYWRAWL